MTLQWTVVAVFLYFEIVCLAILLLPWIRPHMWQKLFRSRLARALEGYTHVYLWAGAGILCLLFFDAIREVRKYGDADMSMENTLHTAQADAIIHMRLFRAQRNLYISGFALFLWFVIRRMTTLISQNAHLQASADALMKQAHSASEAANKLIDGAEDGKEAEDAKVTALKETIKTLEKELETTSNDRDAMKKQSENLQKEYDRLADEHEALQATEVNKKDD